MNRMRPSRSVALNHGRNGIDDLCQPFARIAQRLFARPLGVLEFLGEVVGAGGELDLLLAQLQEVAGTCDKLLMVDRAVEEIGSAGLERAQPEFALLIDRDDDYGNFVAIGLRAKPADEFRTVHRRHLEIGDDQIRRVVLEPGEEFRWVAEAAYRHARFDRSGKLRKNLAVGFPVIEDDY